MCGALPLNGAAPKPKVEVSRRSASLLYSNYQQQCGSGARYVSAGRALPSTPKIALFFFAEKINVF
jgi:hypothetical protein